MLVACRCDLPADDCTFQLEETVKENGEQLSRVKQQLEERQSERNRIKYEVTTYIGCRLV